MGMLRAVFIIEARNYYSKSTFIITNKTRETCVHIGYFIHSRCIHVLLQNCLRVTRHPTISNFECPVLKITEKRTA